MNERKTGLMNKITPIVVNSEESGGICERKTLLRMKKEADQAGFKGTRTGPSAFQITYIASTSAAYAAEFVFFSHHR